MSQNYKRLGLSSKLNAATGGTEKKANKDANEAIQKRDSLAIAAFSAAKLQAQEVQVERDPETGKDIFPNYGSLRGNLLHRSQLIRNGS